MIDVAKLGKEWQYGIGIGQGNGTNGMNGDSSSSSGIVSKVFKLLEDVQAELHIH